MSSNDKNRPPKNTTNSGKISGKGTITINRIYSNKNKTKNSESDKTNKNQKE